MLLSFCGRRIASSQSACHRVRVTLIFRYCIPSFMCLVVGPIATRPVHLHFLKLSTSRHFSTCHVSQSLKNARPQSLFKDSSFAENHISAPGRPSKVRVVISKQDLRRAVSVAGALSMLLVRSSSM
ncbi:hypothetical protein BDR07DRAFT_344203 [Suillus spraguei]|nr:hypothetical protein BDR07DRAFT_344203 [Suillus spraguei]